MNCRWCDESLEDNPTPGVTMAQMHPECVCRVVIGSVAHIERRCACFVLGSTEGDDPALTKCQAASASLACWRTVKLNKTLAMARGRNN